ncbi:ATP-binding protein [Halomicroarcula sp. S1AR25-4]|uniref:histidine kinase N-terminal 7TM domain-containing protein n=1 Tax=Haloarcula sp. S1AR25-4 TaxID=2950538 RepID=UPI002876DA2E|nr:histidine kinase N-terminal 7TM domain-containing protein [Halomicroarcula sp. S1AR25-4]MDS0278367.1 ATP-binding protein [Halomicroarcula sp. S1AR25-4]
MLLSPLSVVLLAAVVGMGVAVLVWLHRDNPGAGPLAAFVVAASLWAVAQGLELAVPDVQTMVWFQQVQLTLSVVVPVAWLVTVLEYTGHPHWLTRRRVALLLAEPAAFVTLVWSNDAHELVWVGSDTVVVAEASALAPVWGLAYWGHLAYMLGLILGGGVLLIRQMLRTNRLFRGQSLALLVAITIPTAAQSLHALGFLGTVVDPTSLGYVVSGIVLSVALLRGQLLDVAPVTRDLGREAIFAEMDDRVVIVDEDGRIVDVNAAAASLFDEDPGALLGRSLEGELPTLAATLPDVGERIQTETRLEHDGAVRYFDVRVTPLYRAYGVVSGHLVSLRDVTNRRQREQRIDVLNRLLRHNIRNEMNVVRGNADLLAGSVESADDHRVDRIIRTVDDIVDRSNKIGRVSEALESEDPRPIRLRPLLAPVVDTVRNRNPGADLSLACPEDCWVEGGPSLTLAVEELLDNAIEHSDGQPTVEVTVEPASPDTGVVVRVSDDGPGIAPYEREVILAGEETPLQHGSGVGLWLVKWVVRNAGGTLSFAEGPGTTVEVELPVADPNDPDAITDVNARTTTDR